MIGLRDFFQWICSVDQGMVLIGFQQGVHQLQCSFGIGWKGKYHSLSTPDACDQREVGILCTRTEFGGDIYSIGFKQWLAFSETAFSNGVKYKRVLLPVFGLAGQIGFGS